MYINEQEGIIRHKCTFHGRTYGGYVKLPQKRIFLKVRGNWSVHAHRLTLPPLQPSTSQLMYVSIDNLTLLLIKFKLLSSPSFTFPAPPVHLAIFPTSELEEVQFLRKKDPKSTTQIMWWPWWTSGGDKLGSRWGPNSDQFLIQIQTQQDLFGGVIFSTAERRAIRPAIAAYSASSPWMV